jgi:DNA invertase Pin-like site-specific DNA recombinase
LPPLDRKEAPLQLDGYIRVSRVGGRDGEAFISPAEQRRQIEAWATYRNARIVRWYEELDQPGSTLNRPLLQEALARCQDGDTGGIVVSHLDRLTRNVGDFVQLLAAAREEAWNIVAVDLQLDLASPNGEFMATLLSTMNQWNLTRIRENWSAAVGNATERGVYISARPPFGYRRRVDGRLERDPKAAPLVVELFRRRAEGESWPSLVKYLREAGHPKSRNGVITIVRNEAYLGVARQGERHRNEAAHEALVDRETWEAAQAKHPYTPHNGSVAAMGLLVGGLLICAGCGHRMSVTGNVTTGKASYYCRAGHKTPCPGPAAIDVAVLDDWVTREIAAAAMLKAHPGNRYVEALWAVDVQRARAEGAVAEAKRLLDEFVANTKIQAVLGAEEYAAGVETRKQDLAAARDWLRELPRADAGIPQRDWSADFYEWTIQQKRAHVRRHVAEVRIGRAGKGKRIPPAERATIRWVGQPDEAAPAA